MMLNVFALCYNEELMLPYFLRHYETIADLIVIYDNGSTDRSKEIIQSHPKTIYRTFDTGNQMSEAAQMNMRNNCWKAWNTEWFTDAEWSIVCDIDEILYHPDLLRFIEDHKEYSILRPYAYTMVTTVIPNTDGQIYAEHRNGCRYPFFDKCILFNSKRIHDMNYGPGSHGCEPTGDVNVWHGDELKLLHYRYLSLERTISKYHAIKDRLSVTTSERGWNTHYLMDDSAIKNVFEETLNKSSMVI